MFWPNIFEPKIRKLWSNVFWPNILLYNPSVINKLYNVILFHRILCDLLVLEIYQIEMYLYNK